VDKTFPRSEELDKKQKKWREMEVVKILALKLGGDG
jgi:hypothetical protein